MQQPSTEFLYLNDHLRQETDIKEAAVFKQNIVEVWVCNWVFFLNGHHFPFDDHTAAF